MEIRPSGGSSQFAELAAVPFAYYANELTGGSTVYGALTVDTVMKVSGTGISGTNPVFQVAGATLTVQVDGKVGIGTASPAGKMTIIGPDTLSGATFLLRQSNNTAYGYDFDMENNSVGRLDLYRVVNGARTQAVSVLRDSGNVGIGTTSPNATLAVASKDTATRPALSIRADGSSAYGFDFDHEQVNVGRLDLYAVVNGARTHSMTISRQSGYVGNVGIGTTGPGYKLTVHQSASGDGTHIARFSGGVTTNGYNEYVSVGSQSGDFAKFGFVYSGTTGNTGAFIAGGSDKGPGNGLFVQYGGNVGIGTSSPGYVLTVAQGTTSDPIADAWNIYACNRQFKTLLGEVSKSSLVERIIAQPVYRYRRKFFVAADNDADKKIEESYPTGLPKFDTERIGISIDDEETPSEILVYENGEVRGIDMVAYVGYLHAVIKELALRVKALENQ